MKVKITKNSSDNSHSYIMKSFLITSFAVFATLGIASARTFVATDAYRWEGDTIIQGDYRAWAPNDTAIISTYHAKPGYYMGIKPEWRLHNDISSYPRLVTPGVLHAATYNMALDEMVNAIEPDSTLRTGAAWGGVWTRDVSYSIILSMAYMQPRASMISLMRKVDDHGRIIQDTGSGGAWPVSTDRVIWAVAAYEIYKVTGDRQWLKYIYPIIKRSLDADIKVNRDSSNGLFNGETSFIDWREQSHPRWMQTADIAATQALGTNVVFGRALGALAEIAGLLGYEEDSARYGRLGNEVFEAINRELWMDEKGYYGMYLYGADNRIMNPRAETLGESLAILWDVADGHRAISVTENNPTTPFGTAIFYPQIADIPPYHNNSLWPWVASFWAMANAKAGNEQGVMEAIGSIIRPAALFCTNKENFILDNGDIATQLNSSNMLWCLAGNLALTHKVLFGINFETDCLVFSPFVPRQLEAERSLVGFKYRDATLDINIKGWGNLIKSFKINGVEGEPMIPGDASGHLTVDIEMDGVKGDPLGINHVANTTAPLTPTAWLEGNVLRWNPMEYTVAYLVLRDGAVVDSVTTTTYDASTPGEYQVQTIGENGVLSFASQPVSNRPVQVVEFSPETIEAVSDEILHVPGEPIVGFTGDGFVESDHASGAITLPFKTSFQGDVVIRLRYANGNGLVSTGNSCAVRTLWVDGKRSGTVVMPHRGEGKWNDWGLSTPVVVPLKPGEHQLMLTIEPENENMNYITNHVLLDSVVLTVK